MNDVKNQNASDTLPYKKAGTLIHGRLKKPKILAGGVETLVPDEHVLVAPYTQGRFYDEWATDISGMRQHGQLVDTAKYYSLLKGAIDPDETLLEAAIRETWEESHIDLRQLLGETNIGRLARGKSVVDYKSKGYPGVHVIRADGVPYEHVYYSRASVPTRMALFNIELDGIEKLAGDLKNQTNRDQPITGYRTDCNVNKTVETMTSDANNFPPFETYLEWLRHGVIPPDGYSIDNVARDGRHKKMHQLLVGGHRGEFRLDPPAPNHWFAQLEHKYAPGGMIGTRQDWQVFCRDIPQSEYSHLNKVFALIKAYAKGRGIIGDDAALIKMDDKDNPLHYYQEGADIVSFERFLSHSLTMAEVNEDYRRAFTGDCSILNRMAKARLNVPEMAGANRDDRAHLLRATQVQGSQLAAIAWSIPKRSIERGVKRFHQNMNRLSADREARATVTPEYQMVEPLLESKTQQKQAWSERVANEGQVLGGLGS